MTAQIFTRICPAGTPVLYQPIKGKNSFKLTKVKSPAWGLGDSGERVLVSVDGLSGGVDVHHLWPVSASFTDDALRGLMRDIEDREA